MRLLRCEELATNLEESIFTQFKQTNPKYKNQVGGSNSALENGN